MLNVSINIPFQSPEQFAAIIANLQKTLPTLGVEVASPTPVTPPPTVQTGTEAPAPAPAKAAGKSKKKSEVPLEAPSVAPTPQTETVQSSAQPSPKPATLQDAKDALTLLNTQHGLGPAREVLSRFKNPKNNYPAQRLSEIAEADFAQFVLACINYKKKD